MNKVKLVLYILILSSCYSKKDNEYISYKESYIDSSQIDTLDIASINLFIKENIDEKINFFGARGKPMYSNNYFLEKINECKEKGRPLFNIRWQKKIKELNLRYYYIVSSIDPSELRFYVLENTITDYKCTLLLPPYHTRQIDRHYKFALILNLDMYKNHKMIGLENFLNNSNLVIEDINMDDIYRLLDMGEKNMGSIVINSKQLEEIKNAYLNNKNYTPFQVKNMFEYLDFLLSSNGIVENKNYKAINLIFQTNKIECLQIKELKKFKPFKEYRFVVNYYVL